MFFTHLFQSCLSNRTQSTNKRFHFITKTYNKWMRHQFLIFRLLFSYYIDTILEGVEYHKIITELNMELKKGDKRLKGNKLTINLRKTDYLIDYLIVTVQYILCGRT